MHSPFDLLPASSQSGKPGRLRPFHRGSIQVLSVDHGGGNLEIPIFTEILKRKATEMECTIYGGSDKMYNVEYESVGEWLEYCQGSHGEWMWKGPSLPREAWTSL